MTYFQNRARVNSTGDVLSYQRSAKVRQNLNKNLTPNTENDDNNKWEKNTKKRKQVKKSEDSSPEDSKLKVRKHSRAEIEVNSLSSLLLLSNTRYVNMKPEFFYTKNTFIA